MSAFLSNSTSIQGLPCSNFQFNQVESEEPSSGRLLVLFAWLFATERQLDKFCRLYLHLGYDVLIVRVHLRNFLAPKSGCKLIARQLVDFLASEAKYSSIVFHAFSLGVYQLGEVILLLQGEEEHQQARRIAGIILDSPVDVQWAPVAFSQGVTDNPLLQWTLQGLLKAHFSFSYNSATKHYLASSEVLRRNANSFPVLMFISENDPVSNYVHLLQIVRRWREGGATVLAKCWPKSRHVSHFSMHPKKYRESVAQFLEIVLSNREKLR